MSFIVRNFLNQLSLWQKQKQKKKNKKQLVLKAEKKYEDRGENVTLNVICQIFALFFFAFNKIANKNLANISAILTSRIVKNAFSASHNSSPANHS